MKKECLLLFAVLISFTAFTQNVGIGTATPNASAQLDITSTSKGILIPRMKTSAITSISNPAKGLLVYDSANNQLMVNMGLSSLPDWQTIVSNSGWNLTGNSGTNPATHFIGANDSVDLVVKTNNREHMRINALGQVTFRSNATNDNSFTFIKDSSEVRLTLESYYDNAIHNIGDGYPYFQMIRNNYYGGIYRPMVIGDLLGRIGVQAPRDSASDYNGDGNLGIDFFATENWSSTKSGSRIAFRTTSKGTNSIYFPLDLNNDYNFHSSVTVVGNGAISDIFQVRSTATTDIPDTAVAFHINNTGSIFMKVKPGVSGTADSALVRDASTGLIAMKSVSTGSGTDTTAWHITVNSGTNPATNGNENDFYRLRYGDFVVPLVKAMQEQQQQIETQKSVIEELKSQNAEMLKRIEALEKK